MDRVAVWLPRGLTGDYEELHDQPDAGHPDHEVMRRLDAALIEETDAAGRPFEIIEEFSA